MFCVRTVGKYGTVKIDNRLYKCPVVRNELIGEKLMFQTTAIQAFITCWGEARRYVSLPRILPSEAHEAINDMLDLYRGYDKRNHYDTWQTWAYCGRDR